jgi:biopolymer transport protein TolQ
VQEVATTNVSLGGQFHGSILDMVINASFMVQFVLLALLFFSVVSWAIIFMKFRLLKKARKENGTFLEMYMKSGKLSEVFSISNKFVNSNLAKVFRAGYAEQATLSKFIKEAPAAGEGSVPSALEIKGIDNIERTFHRASSTEITRMESTLGFLATTGSVCPFIGLFGTVWGIMDTFRGIGAKGSATLAVVAPGISEALVATAAGLAAAIPAVVFYNYFQNGIKIMVMEMDGFISELLNILERYYAKR